MNRNFTAVERTETSQVGTDVAGTCTYMELATKAWLQTARVSKFHPSIGDPVNLNLANLRQHLHLQSINWDALKRIYATSLLIIGHESQSACGLKSA